MVAMKTDITLPGTVEVTFGVTMVGNLTIGAQLVLCSTKNEEAASIFTTLVSHAEQNHAERRRDDSRHQTQVNFVFECIRRMPWH